jgi:hypothetical protein
MHGEAGTYDNVGINSGKRKLITQDKKRNKKLAPLNSLHFSLTNYNYLTSTKL